MQNTSYRVRVATFEAFSAMVTGAGLDFHPIRGDARMLVNALRQGFLECKRTNPLRAISAMRRRAADLCQRISAEDGIQRAVQIIDQLGV